MFDEQSLASKIEYPIKIDQGLILACCDPSLGIGPVICLQEKRVGQAAIDGMNLRAGVDPLFYNLSLPGVVLSFRVIAQLGK